MKEFDLEKAKAGHPVCTRDGREVRILCFDKEGSYPIVALVKDSGTESIFSYNNKGRSNDTSKCSCDLFMRIVKREAWINLYKDKGERLFPGLILFESEKEAKDRMESGEKSSRLYYKTVKIEWED